MQHATYKESPKTVPKNHRGGKDGGGPTSKLLLVGNFQNGKRKHTPKAPVHERERGVCDISWAGASAGRVCAGRMGSEAGRPVRAELREP